MDYEKIVLVRRKTRLEELVERFNTTAQARFYLEHSGIPFRPYETEHEVYYAALDRLQSDLQKIIRIQVIERSFLPNFLFTESDMVVTLGVDGLVVNTAKYLEGQSIIAVNPDPAHIDGILLPFRIAQAAGAVRSVLHGQAHTRLISMAEAQLNDGQSLLAFNDLFIGARSHISARYRLQVDGKEERQSSSGVIISTGAGSTGWLSSLINMANGIYHGFGRQTEELESPRMDWESEQLIFAVREPFASKTSGVSIVFGKISAEHPLDLVSEMPEGGVIFSDGVEADYLAFNAGAIARIAPAAKKTHLVIV